MMKSKKLILEFINTVRAKNENDALGIETFLAKNYNLYVRLSLTNESLVEITFEQFKDFFVTPLPQRNDIVVIEPNQTIGIVKCIKNGKIIFGALLKNKYEFVSSESEALLHVHFRKATGPEMIEMQTHFFKHNLAWSTFLSTVVPRSKIKHNQYIRVSILGQVIAHGVFKEVNDAGEVILYFVKEIGQLIRYSLSEVIGDESELQLNEVCLSERIQLTTDLKMEGKVWNGNKSRIEPVSFRLKKPHARLKKGKYYYYIDDYFSITRVEETGAHKDKKRCSCGNYYRTFEEAKALLDSIKHERHRQYEDYLKTNVQTQYPRVQTGDCYYYINNHLVVHKATETGAPKDKKRYASDNYFIYFDEAKSLLVFIIEIRKKMLIPYSGKMTRAQSKEKN